MPAPADDLWFTRKQKAALMAAVTTLLLALVGAAGAWASSLHSKVDTISAQQERIIKIESRSDELDARLTRMENKLDRILFGIREKEDEEENMRNVNEPALLAAAAWLGKRILALFEKPDPLP